MTQLPYSNEYTKGYLELCHGALLQLVIVGALRGRELQPRMAHLTSRQLHNRPPVNQRAFCPPQQHSLRTIVCPYSQLV